MFNTNWRCFFVLVIVAASCFRVADADDAPSPAYRAVENFPQLPAGFNFGPGSGVATNSKGELLVFRRAEPPVLVFSPAGELLRSFGKDLFATPHGLRVDAHDNVWVTDSSAHIVIKFDSDGKVLMTLGEKGVAGADEKHFNRPTDIAVTANGDFFVGDGYGNSRIVKFDKDGKFLLAWGKKGTGDGEFNIPHAVRLDSKGDVYVADRDNRRIQVFSQDGKYIRQFGGFSPFGLFITPDDLLFVADGRANKIFKMTNEGKVIASWGTTGAKPGNYHEPHGITVGRDGAVYVSEIEGKRVQKLIAAP